MNMCGNLQEVRPVGLCSSHLLSGMFAEDSRIVGRQQGKKILEEIQGALLYLWSRASTVIKGDLPKVSETPTPWLCWGACVDDSFPSLNGMRIHCLGAKQAGEYLGCDPVMRPMVFVFGKLDHLPLLHLMETSFLVLFHLSWYWSDQWLDGEREGDGRKQAFIECSWWAPTVKRLLYPHSILCKPEARGYLVSWPSH